MIWFILKLINYFSWQREKNYGTKIVISNTYSIYIKTV